MFATLTAIAVPLSAQVYQRRANLIGNGNSDRGKCTVEVVVDGAAEVEIRGDTGILRNLSGQPPQWRRFECTGPLPSNAAEFRFAGVDGRGRQQLVRDPRNGGTAVVRIEDSGGGAEAYTFDIEWRGGSGYNPGQRRNEYGDRGNNRRFSTEDAVRVCQEGVRQQAAERFNARNIEFLRTDLDDNPGRRDWVVGAFRIRRGGSGDDTYRFSCSVDFDSGQVRSVRIDPAQDGRSAPGYGNSAANSNAQVMRQCERAVEQRIQRDGYGRVEFESVNVENRPGPNDSVVGRARVDGRNGSDFFNFSCAVNLDNGNVRSVEVNRR
jgi:hypothetical protein